MRDLEELFGALAKSAFRQRFRLGMVERRYLDEKGLEVVRRHAREFVKERLAAAKPTRDGRQTPMRGHPVFVAQHATATCCRSCLEKWHGVAKGIALTKDEVDYVVRVLIAWMVRQPASEPGSSVPTASKQRQLFE